MSAPRTRHQHMRAHDDAQRRHAPHPGTSNPRASNLIRALAATALVMAAMAAPAAHAADVLYRCTDAAGRVTWQNRTPCAKGQQQQIRHIEVPPARTPPLLIAAPGTSPSSPTASTSAVTPAATAASPPAPAVTAPSVPTTLPAAPAAPPPALWRCLRWDGDDTVQESATPATHCRPLATTGLDGNAQDGAGSACETVHDVCTPVPDAALCTVWKNRVDEARFRWRYAGDGPAAAARQAEYDALAARYGASSCALAPKNQ